MTRRFGLAIALTALGASAHSQLQWQKTVTLEAPTTGAAVRALSDAKGNVYFGLDRLSGDGSILKFGPNGALTTQFEGSGKFRLGRFDDVFSCGREFRRTNRTTGALIWSRPVDGNEIFTDENGSPYLWRRVENQAYLEKRAISSGALIWSRQIENPMFIDGPNFLGWVKAGPKWDFAVISKKFGAVVTSFPATRSVNPQVGDSNGSEAFFYVKGPYSDGVWFYKDGAATEIGRLAYPHLGRIKALCDSTFAVLGDGEVSRYGSRFNRLWRTSTPSSFRDGSVSNGKLALLNNNFVTSSAATLDLATGVVSSYTTTQMYDGEATFMLNGKLWVGGSKMPDRTASVEVYDAGTMALLSDWGDTHRSNAWIEPFGIEMAGSGEPLIAIASWTTPRLVRLTKDGALRWSTNLADYFQPNSRSGAKLTVSSDKKFALVAFTSGFRRMTEGPGPFTVRVDLSNGAITQSLPGLAYYAGSDELYAPTGGSLMRKNSAGVTLWSSLAHAEAAPIVDASGDVYVYGNGQLAKLDGGTGDYIWTRAFSDYTVALVITGDLLIVNRGGASQAYRTSDGSQAWQSYPGFGFQGTWGQLAAYTTPEGVHLSDINGYTYLIDSIGNAREEEAGFITKSGTRYFFERFTENIMRQQPGSTPSYFTSARKATMFAWDSQAAFMLGRLNNSLTSFTVAKLKL